MANYALDIYRQAKDQNKNAECASISSFHERVDTIFHRHIGSWKRVTNVDGAEDKRYFEKGEQAT